MAKTIIVNVTSDETRMALLEDGSLTEVLVERNGSGQLVGNIYKGRIKNVLPGIRAAFVDIGREKNGFIITGEHSCEEGPPQEGRFTVGKEILVQVAKDAIGTKGPRLTAQVTLPGRYVVLMPTVEFVGVSRRIESETERQRLRDVANRIRPAGMGIIVRTVAAGKDEGELERDIEYLVSLWKTLLARANRASAPLLLYRDVELIIRLVRDYFSDDVDEYILDNPEAYQRVTDLLKFVSPGLAARLVLYEGQEELFTRFGVDAELEKLRQRRVWLKCGGYLVFDRTEALTVIDVNTGKFVGDTAFSNTVLQTNLEAAAEIARQIRLRDIGGIIIIDFIDMDKEEQQVLLKTFEEELKKDRTKTAILGITSLGLVEMTRKKIRQDLESILYSECPCCGGRGIVRSPETVAIDIRRKLRSLCKSHPTDRRLIIQVHPRVAELLKDKGVLEQMSRDLSRQLVVEAVPAMHAEAYSILQGRE